MSHANARLTPRGRELAASRVRASWARSYVAAAMGCSRGCVSRWVERFAEEGIEGLQDRSSRPGSSPTRTPELCINGNEWAKRQADQAGIGFAALGNAFAAIDDVAAAQSICASLSPEQIDALLRKWLARLPHPFSPEDTTAGYRYDISVLQAEFSLTQVLDRPVTGRIFFEQVIRDTGLRPASGAEGHARGPADSAPG